MNQVQRLIAEIRSHEILAKQAPIPDCDGVADCYFCAAAELARRSMEGKGA